MRLTLDDIAYFNVVRCRTNDNTRPGASVARRCLGRHLAAWLDALQPRVVVFIGKWAFDQASAAVRARGIPCDFMNRARHLDGEERRANRRRVATLVRDAAAGG